jgi:hypothetical protein
MEPPLFPGRFKELWNPYYKDDAPPPAITDTLTVTTLSLPTDLRLLGRDSTGITIEWSDLDGGPVERYLVYRDSFPAGDRAAGTGFVPVGALTPIMARATTGSKAYYGNLVFGDPFTTAPLWTYVYRVCPIVDGMTAVAKAALPNLPNDCSADFAIDGLPGGAVRLGVPAKH